MNRADKKIFEIKGTMFLLKVCGGCYRYQERPENDGPAQVSDAYIQKFAMGGHPPDELKFSFTWEEPKEADAKEENEA